MKRFVVILLSIFFSGMFSVNSFSSTIAVVDLQKAMTDCKAGKNAKAKISSVIEAKRVVIDRKVSSIKKLADELKSGKLSAEAKEEKTALYKDKIKELERYKNDAADEIREKEREISSTIINALIQIIKRYSIAHKIDAVFEVHQGVIYWNDKLDITQNVINMYNKEYISKK